MVLQIVSHRRTNPHHWVVLLGAHALCIVSIVFVGDSFPGSMLFDFYLRFAVFGGMGLILVSFVRDARLLLFWFFILSLFSSGLIIRQVSMTGMSNLLTYYMPIAYQILYMALVVPLMCLLTNKRWAFFFLSGVLLFLLMYIGARGAVMAFTATLIVAYMLHQGRTEWWSRFLALILMVGIVITLVGMSWLGTILNSAKRLVDTTNETSRMSRLLASDSVTWDSGRSDYYDVIKRGIINAPLGAGIGSDRLLLHQAAISDSYRSYAHNIFLEVLLHFGWVGGGILLILLHYAMIRGIFKSKDRYWQIMVILCIGCWYFPRMVSSTYLVPQTLVAIGVFMSSYVRIRRHIPGVPCD